MRAGKTVGVAAGFMWFAWRYPSRRIANASISADQANIVYNECLKWADYPRFKHWITKVERHPYPRILLGNGSELWFRSVGYEAELWRGQEFDWINVDEAAYVLHYAAITTLRGRLIGPGRHGIFTMTSTPHGKSWLSDRWRLGDPSYPESKPEQYLSMRARTLDNTHLSAEQVEEEMAKLSPRERQQEFEGLFLDQEDQVFPPEDIYAACMADDPVVQELNKQIRRYLERHTRYGPDGTWYGKGEITHYELDPEPGHSYLSSWDLGKKTDKAGRGANVGVVLDITQKPWRLVAYRWEANSGYIQAMAWIEEWDQKYKLRGRSRCDTMIDATGKGDVVNTILQEERRLDVDGVVYSSASKPLYITSGQVMFGRPDYIRMPFIRRLFDQFTNYVTNDKDIPQDIVMALCQAAYGARERTGDFQHDRLQLPTRSGYRTPYVNLDRFELRRKLSRGKAANPYR